MIAIFWDASQIWGYLLLHAVRSSGVPFRILKASEILQSGLSCKLFLAPGGSARRKMAALGPQGMATVRDFVSRGGRYLGFCGGAGLALADGIGLCPWKRDAMPDRLQHLVSGSLVCSVEQDPLVPQGLAGRDAQLPVWWPGRFAEPGSEKDAHGVRVLARYRAPGSDLHVADMPFSSMPEDILDEWRDMYGASLRPSLLDGMPCAIAGGCGKGEWLLSYSHLETPCAQDAGAWFLHLLQCWTGVKPAAKEVPPLDPDSLPDAWGDDVLAEARGDLRKLLALGMDLGLLFARNIWLLGWRTGVPGSQLNSLRLALAMTPTLPPDSRRTAEWKQMKREFARLSSLFFQGARSWLLARRLADTLAESAPGMLPRELLYGQKEALFGSPMSGGGLCGQMLDMLERIV